MSGRRTGRALYTAALAEAVCRRLEAGESLGAICADPAMPSCSTVMRWRSGRADFRARYRAARERQREWAAAGGPPVPGGGGVDRYRDALAVAICERLAAGESLTALCTDPEMPCLRTVLNWLERLPDFRAAYARARTLQAHMLADEVLHTVRRDDLAPADKQVRLKGLTWMAGRLAPTKYGEAAPEGPETEGPLIVVVQNGGYEGTG